MRERIFGTSCHPACSAANDLRSGTSAAAALPTKNSLRFVVMNHASALLNSDFLRPGSQVRNAECFVESFYSQPRDPFSFALLSICSQAQSQTTWSIAP